MQQGLPAEPCPLERCPDLTLLGMQQPQDPAGGPACKTCAVRTACCEGNTRAKRGMCPLRDGMWHKYGRKL
jgi:hypothetical protein